MVAWAAGSEWRTRPENEAGFLFLYKGPKRRVDRSSGRGETFQSRGPRRALDSKKGRDGAAEAEMGTVSTRIKPYWYDGAWVFDDFQRGLRAKPFITRAPAIVDHVLRRAGLQPRQPFTVTFGDHEFPALGYQFVLEWVREDAEGHWYRWGGMDGLCPALVRYFEAPPKRIYCEVTVRRTPFSVFHADRVGAHMGDVEAGRTRFSPRSGRG